MKKLVLSIFAVSLFAAGVQAQHCSATNNNATPITFAQPGLQPYSEDLPCTVIGTAVSDTIYFQNYTTISLSGTTATVNSLRIDTIGNLPPGLCWTTNRADNTFNGGQAGVIIVSGTPTGPVGQYKLRIIVTVNASVGGFPLTVSNVDAEQRTGLRYWIRTKCASPSVACTLLDTLSPYPSYIPYAPCLGPPTAAINPSGTVTICQGASQTLTATTGTGYTYKWSTGATTQAITATTAGAYTVTVYNAILDSTVSAATTLVVNTPPTVSITPAGPDSICPGDSVRLVASGTGLTYLWSNGATTQTISVRTAGSYGVTATNANTCSAAAPNNVTVVVRPTTVPTVTRTGFVLSSSAATTYQWYKDGAILTGDTAQTVTATTNGSYTVRVTNASGCETVSAATSVVNVGITDINGNTILTVYPNPTAGAMTLQTSGRTGDSYTITDAVGRTIQTSTISADRMLLDLSAQQSGIYTLTVLHGGSRETVRFTVAK